MSRVKAVLIVLFAVFVVGALAVSSASATWLVGGSPLSGSAALAQTALVHISTKLLVPAVTDLSVACGGEAVGELNARIELTTKIFEGELVFIECSVISPASGCALEKTNQTISTFPILGSAAKATGEGDTVTFTPETKSTLAEIKFSEANTCAFNGVEPVKGSVKVGVPTGQLELASQAIVGLGSSENNSLEVANSKAYLIGGDMLLKLASGTPWSFK